MKITLAHSPDADDAFMFYPLMSGKVDTHGIAFEETRSDIATLNREAVKGTYDVTAISFHAYPSIQESYILLSVGACFGEKYGPVLISHKPLKPKQALKLRAAVPGKNTTAFLVMKLWERAIAGEGRSGISVTEVPFDKILDEVIAQKKDLGLLIHEGQLVFQEKGLHKVVDLGEWWDKETSLPLPLGGIVVRRSLDWETQKRIALAIQDSIRYALGNREECVQAALPFARGLDSQRADQFIGMYVNDLTVDWGRKGLKAVKTLFEKAFQARLISQPFDSLTDILSLKQAPVHQDETIVEEGPPVQEVDENQEIDDSFPETTSDSEI